MQQEQEQQEKEQQEQKEEEEEDEEEEQEKEQEQKQFDSAGVKRIRIMLVGSAVLRCWSWRSWRGRDTQEVRLQIVTRASEVP